MKSSRRLIRLGILCCFLAAAAAGAEVPAPGDGGRTQGQAEVREVAQAAPSEAARNEAAAAPIVMYTTSWCGYCRKARTLFGELGIAFQDLDVEKDRAALRAKDKLDPSCGVPLIDFGGEVICGFREDRIRELAAQRKAAETSPGAESSGDGGI